MRSICILVQNVYDHDIRVRRKAEALVAAGHSVDVLALRASASAKRYTLNGVQVFTVPLGKKRGSRIRYAFEYAAFFLWASALVALRTWRHRYDVIDVNTLPDFLVFAAAGARWMGAKIVLDMHEITPEFFMSKYGVGERSAWVRLLQWIERRSFGFADRVITINEPIRELLERRGLPRWKSSVIMNAVDEALFTGHGAPAPAADPVPGRFVMMYHGTLTSVYGMALGIEALALARREVPGAELRILGSGPELNALQELARRRDVASSVRFLPLVPPGDVAALVSECDAGVLPMRRDVFLEFAFPNKLSEYIVLGKPVMMPRLRTIRHYFSDDALAYFEPDDPADLARQMIRLAHDPELRTTLARRAREEYAPIRWDVMRARYLRVIDDVARGGAPAPQPAPAPADLTAVLHDARTTALSLLEYCRRNDWAGHDPYDALNSRLLGALPMLDTKPMRLVLTQALKRSPVDIRDLALVPRTQNAKALGLFLASLLKLARAGVPGTEALVEPMIQRLIARRSPGQSHWCWGYSFPWQTRTSVVPRGEPNLVCTSFVGGALLDAAEQGDRRCLDMAVSAADWIAGALYREHGDGPGFAYPLPSSEARIHNANLLGAAFLCRVARLTGESALVEPAMRVARATTSHQRPDGSWPYGEGPHQGWIDNFHTGYNLCALSSIGRDAQTDEFEVSVRDGLAFYRRHFFRQDGAPRYFHDRTYPIDAHCVAQSIITLVELQDRDPDNLARAASVFRWAMANLWDRRGFVYYRKLRLCTIRTSYMRWSQAWMLLALATLIDDQRARLSPVNERALTVTAR
jgi:glycosyltransferase involved in cell wall biosynthesis